MDSEIDIRNLIGMLRRQIWLIISVVVAITVLSSVIVYSLTPRYTANALVMVDTSAKNLLDPETGMRNSGTDNARVDSEVEIFDSDGILLDVINSNNLIQDDEFGIKLSLQDKILNALHLKASEPPTGEKALGSVLSSFRQAVTVKRSGLTYLISVSVESKDPVKAANLANAVTDAYIRQQVASKISSTIAARDIIQSRVKAASDAIVDNEKKFDAFISDNMDRIEKSSGASGVSSLRDELQQINQARLENQQKLATADTSLQSGDIATLVATLESDSLKELQRQRDALSAQIANAPAGEVSAIDLRAQLAKLDEGLKEQARTEVNSLQTSVSTLDEKETSLRQEMRSKVMSSNLPPEVLTQIYSLQQSAEISRTQYQSLLARLQDVQAQADLQVADSRVVSKALTPPVPSYPKKNLLLSLAAIAALGLGIGLAIIREYFVGGFTNEDQIESVLRIPLATVMPRQSSGSDDSAKGDSHSISDLIITSPLSMFSESVRRIRVTVDQAFYKKNNGAAKKANDGIVVMISSSVPNEGKSTLSMSLARTYAMAGKRTLLIDCDLRKPSIHKQLGLEPNFGFLDYLRGADSDNPLQNIKIADPLTSLTVLLGGRRSDFATDDLVMGERISRLLMSAKKHFDYIVLDSPPIEPVVDGLYLAKHADVIAFVIKWASTSQSTARKSVNALVENAALDTPIIGILNQQDRAKLSGNYSYSSYYTE
jgi:polysaccharide biosynthesis transport protein